MTDEEIKDNVRKQITKYRKLSGLKQEELGKLLGLKKTTISSWEVGKSMPDVCTLYKLSKIFNVSISTLYNAQLEINEDAPAKGTVLEIKEETGLGLTVDSIIYDGVLRTNDER